jgi:Zn-dependent protease with chaperone function
VKGEQLKGLWKWIKIGFRKRITIGIALIVSISIYTSASFSLLRGVTAISILVTAELWVICYVPRYINQMGLLFRTKAVERPLPKEIVSLARRMGLKIQKMKTVPNVCNAYVRGKQLFVGEDLLKKLDMSQLKAVCAHEFGHIKGRHTLIQTLYLLPIITYLCLFWQNLPAIILELGIFAYMIMMLMPLQWEFEKRADYAGVKYVGKEEMKSALLMLETKETLDEPSETHPATSKRLKWIDNAILT